MNRGLFITFEGAEGCGKSTQAQLLAEWLQDAGMEVYLTKEPGEGSIGGQIRRIILSPENAALSPVTEAILYAADRRQHVEEFLQPALAAGKIVICDRYADSYLAYQGYGRGLDQEMLRALNQLAAGALQPDVTFLLDLPPAESFLRLAGRGQGPDRMEQQAKEFHQRVYQGYLEIAAAEPQRVVVIPAQGGPAEIAGRIQQEMKKWLDRWAEKKTD